MAGSVLPEQEFVVHVFAPMEGPAADAAYRQLEALWQRCGDELTMTEPISGVDLPVELPGAPPAAGPDRTLAGRQDAAINYQAIVRQEHDVLNLSLVFATPLAPPARRVRIGSAAPPGWSEFARWWGRLSAGGTDALLGVALIFQAKTSPAGTDVDAWGADVWALLPREPDDAVSWWRRFRRTEQGLTLWEATAGGDRARRRLVVLADRDHDAVLSTFTWSAGDVAMPPLGRYLMHAAKLRYQARIRGDGQQLAALRKRVMASVQQVTANLEDPARHAGRATDMATLAADEVQLTGTLSDLRLMRRTVGIALHNMRSVLDEPLASDARLGEWLEQQLADDAEILEITRQEAERVRGIARDSGLWPPLPHPPAHSSLMAAPEPAVKRNLGETVETRMAFGIDVVGYSSRPAPLKIDLQRRVAALVGQVLGDAGVRLEDTDRQDTGDGMMVVLPTTVELHLALPRLLHAWRDRLEADNEIHRDRLRMRLSVSVGPFALGAIGYAGDTIIEIGRLLDSDALRRAVTDHPAVSLAALVSERLYQDVIGEGWPGLAAAEFQQVLVEVKTFRRTAWLWLATTDSATIPAGLIEEALRLLDQLRGWEMGELRWQSVERALEVAEESAETSDGPGFAGAIEELGQLGPVRAGRIGAQPQAPAPASAVARADRLSRFLGTLAPRGGENAASPS
ncbi:CATRA conflict system CASPASE/TPR repeat-associated protein [Actinoplanes sp. RD1]|uniref:CATRA conflict system CASPASE/TPR repeat-associated protein n=1 Tax=Actinoplanes sp. RD1 TaxID=3064538 RepID=UPI002741CC65|nr:CATRA conflict system CASPASE/TPR repeat-associated protein [Actinoplanes sp. RD1]